MMVRHERGWMADWAANRISFLCNPSLTTLLREIERWKDTKWRTESFKMCVGLTVGVCWPQIVKIGELRLSFGEAVRARPQVLS
jgi:hypothetical protein